MFVRLHDFKCTPNTLGGKYSLYIIEIKCQTIYTYVNLLINYRTGIQAADLYILNKSFKMVIIFSLQCPWPSVWQVPFMGRFLLSDFDRAYFWKWTYFESYVQFTVVFTVLVGLTTWLFLDNMYYVETIGFLAVFAEAMLGAPQFHRNFINKSTHGMR